MNREIEHQLEAAMTVRHIREALEGADDDARVFFVCSYGDYHHTQQALPVGEVNEDHDSNDLAETAYSHSRVCLVDEDAEGCDCGCGEDEPDEDVFPVVILRS